MASDYIKLVGHQNRHTDWTAEVVLERDEDGNVTRSVKAGVPTNDLTAEERKGLEERGLVFESSSATEAKEAQATQTAVGSDVAGTAPILNPGSGAASSKSNDK